MFIIEIAISVNIHIITLSVCGNTGFWRYRNIPIEAKLPVPFLAAILHNYS